MIVNRFLRLYAVALAVTAILVSLPTWNPLSLVAVASAALILVAQKFLSKARRQELADESDRVSKLRGVTVYVTAKPEELAWPKRCPCCGESANTSVKAFGRPIDVPYCSVCAKHKHIYDSRFACGVMFAFLAFFLARELLNANNLGPNLSTLGGMYMESMYVFVALSTYYLGIYCQEVYIKQRGMLRATCPVPSASVVCFGPFRDGDQPSDTKREIFMCVFVSRDYAAQFEAANTSYLKREADVRHVAV